MEKKTKIIIGSAIIVLILSFFVVPQTLSLLRSATTASGGLALADWNASIVDSGSNDTLVIVPETYNANYILSVRSVSEVDVKYSIVITNLTAGVEVSLDGGSFQTQVNNTITFTNVGTILYTDNSKIRTHTLTFRAVSGATYVNDRTVDINAVFEQIL